eukprot:jgi/Botrbrau1/4383/Bobra.105_2s0029.1
MPTNPAEDGVAVGGAVRLSGQEPKVDLDRRSCNIRVQLGITNPYIRRRLSMEGDNEAAKLQVDGTEIPSQKCIDSPVSARRNGQSRLIIKRKSSFVAKEETGKERNARIWTTFTTMFAFIVERADESVLTSTYAFIGRDLNATPAQLGVISMWRGLLGDRLNRAWLIGVGALIWGVMTAGIGASKTLSQAMGFAAANGVGLAILIPCAQSLLADYYHPTSRGLAFWRHVLHFQPCIGGGMVGHVEGWRFSFYIIAALSGLAAVLSFLLGSEPRTVVCLLSFHQTDKGTHQGSLQAGGEGLVWMWRRIKEMARDLSLVLRIPTFIMIVIQGFFGTMPWMAMGFMTLYLQMLGFSDVRAAAAPPPGSLYPGKSWGGSIHKRNPFHPGTDLEGADPNCRLRRSREEDLTFIWAIFNLGNSIGNFAGGIIGDYMSKKFPKFGRVFSAHFSAAMSIPYAVIVLRCLPVDTPNQDKYFGLYTAVFFLFSLVISWPYTNNSAIYSEIVPEQLRTSVFAFDRCFEGAVGSTAGPLVGLQEHNARALGNAMLGILLFFWVLCITFYFALYWTFPRDRLKSAALGRRLEQEALEAAGKPVLPTEADSTSATKSIS